MYDPWATVTVVQCAEAPDHQPGGGPRLQERNQNTLQKVSMAVKSFVLNVHIFKHSDHVS